MPADTLDVQPLDVQDLEPAKPAGGKLDLQPLDVQELPAQAAAPKITIDPQKASTEALGRQGLGPASPIEAPPDPVLREAMRQEAAAEPIHPERAPVLEPLAHPAEFAAGAATRGLEPGAEPAGGEVVRGARELATPGQRVAGAVDVLAGGFGAIAPVVGPATLENPVGMAKSLAAGLVGQEAGKKVGEKLNVKPETQALLEYLGLMAPMVLGAVQPKVAVEPGRAQVSAFGNRVAVGGGVTPEEVVGGVRVGGRQVGVRIPRAGAPPAEGGPSLEPPTIEAQPAPPPAPGERAAAAAAEAKAQHDVMEQAGTGAAQHAKAVQAERAKPVEEPDVVGNKISHETLEEAGKQLAKIPEDKRPEALITAQGRLAKQLLQKGKIVGPDNKVHTVKTEEQADALAAQMLNEHAVPAQEKALKETQAQAKPAGQKKLPSSPAGNAKEAAKEAGVEFAGMKKVEGGAVFRFRDADGTVGVIPREEEISPATIKASIQRTRELAQPKAEAAAATAGPPAEVAVTGKPTEEYPAGKLAEEPETERDILQPEETPKQLNQMAKEEAPTLEAKLEDALQGVSDAEFARVRPEKDMGRVKEKIQGEGQPPETIPDYLASQVVAHTEAGKDAAVQAIEQKFKVLRKTDLWDKGDPDYHYHHIALQVEMPNGLSAEVHIVPREVHAVNTEEHHEYKAAREAEISGDKEVFARESAKAKETNDQAFNEYLARVGGAAASSEKLDVQPVAEEKEKKPQGRLIVKELGSKRTFVIPEEQPATKPGFDFSNRSTDSLRDEAYSLKNQIKQKERTHAPIDNHTQARFDAIEKEVAKRTEPIASFKNEQDGMESRVTLGDGGTYNVTLHDLDSGNVLDRVTKYQTQEQAVANAKELIGQKVSQEVKRQGVSEKPKEAYVFAKGDRVRAINDRREKVEGTVAYVNPQMGAVRIRLDGGGMLTRNYKTLEKLAPAEPGKPTIKPNEADDERPSRSAEPAGEGNRELGPAAGARREPLAETLPQAGGEAGEGRETPASPRAGGRDHHPEPAAEREERPAAGPGEGAGLPEHPAAGREPRRAVAKAPAKNTGWFSHPENFDPSAGTVTRLQRNLKAIKLVRELEEKPRALTDEDREALSQYIGWGALQWAFSPGYAPWSEQQKWRQAYTELQSLLTPEEIAAARHSVTNAHYTSPQVVRFAWSVLERMGFKGGSVLEPSMGAGNFFGMMPKKIRARIDAVGNELEPLTFKIAQLLYPGAKLFNKDFKDLILPNDSIDLAISNVPFGEKVYDPKYPKLGAKLHDYFFVKSLDKVRPGGVVAFITSSGTLDKRDAYIREILHEKAKLLFAVRFPATAFEKTAGTHVTTDLLILQKRLPGETEGGEDFLKVVEGEWPHEQKEGETAKQHINIYFHNNPENVLGQLAVSARMYGNDQLVVLPDEKYPLTERLNDALKRAPRGTFDTEKSPSPSNLDTPANFAPDTLLPGSYTVDEKGRVLQNLDGKLVPAEAVADKGGKPSLLLAKRMKQLIELRDQTNKLLGEMKTQPDDDAGNAAIGREQAKLKKLYDAYVKAHGYLGGPKSRIFEDDPHYSRLLALEDYDRIEKKGTPVDIFTKRTIFPRQELKALSPDLKEGFLQVLAERGKPDLELMARLSGKPLEELQKQLSEKELVFREPITGEWQVRDKYLSGHIREKMRDAEAAIAQGHEEYKGNLEALKKVVPAAVPIAKIQIKPGGTYIPTSAIEEFINTTFGTYRSQVQYVGGTWYVGKVPKTAAVTADYGSQEFPADELLEMALNQKKPIAYDSYTDEDGNEKRVINPQRTLAAKAKQERLVKAFHKFFQEHKTWAPELERLYNYQFNSLVPLNPDGSHLTFPGMNPAIQLDPHQKNFVWRVLLDGRGLAAHVVGAGKTFSMATAAMECRRTGLAKKPMLAVPKHLVEQWRNEFLRLYPAANILVASKKDFEKQSRRRFLNRIATGDWDAVIVSHPQFGKVNISPEHAEKTIQAMKRELEETIRQAEAAEQRSGDRKKSRTVKQLEKAKDNLDARLAELRDLPRDQINFDDLGVDMLFVDEAHEFKNLAFYTKMNRVAGLGQGDAKRALDMKMKTDYLLERSNGRGVIFGTGTPVQNTMAELNTMIRYVAPDVLEKAGIKFFDDWAANFGEVITAMELSADAATYKPRDKFSRFVNVPEMMQQFISFADIKTHRDLPGLQARLPKLEGGNPINIEVTTPEIEPYMRELIRRTQRIRGEAMTVFDENGKPKMEEVTDANGKKKLVPVVEHADKPDPHEDNMLKVTDHGRKVATDLRLYDPNLPDNPNSKINRVVDQVFKDWQEGQAERTTQLVFLDRFENKTRMPKLDDEGRPVMRKIKTAKGYVEKPVYIEKINVNLYHDMRDKLVRAGVPREEIAIIHDYDTDVAKQKLFDDMNAGRVRILMGSTQKMGAGMNVQKRLKSLHHVDLPWKPGEIEQREGRIVRQGNTNQDVRIYYYLTKKSFDAYMAQTMRTKAEFIWQIMSGQYQGREVADVAGDMVINLEAQMAIASGNPDVKRRVELQAEMTNLMVLKREHESQFESNHYRAEAERQHGSALRGALEAMKDSMAAYQKAVGEKGEDFHLKILGKEFAKRDEAGKALESMEVPAYNFIMELNGIQIPVRTFNDFNRPVLEYSLPWERSYFDAPQRTMGSLLLSTAARLRSLPEGIAQQEKWIQRSEEHAQQLEALSKPTPFPEAARLKDVEKEMAEVNKRLGMADESKLDAEQEVALEADTDDEDVSSEDEAVEGGDVVMGMTIPLPIEAFKKFYQIDVGPGIEKLGRGFLETADAVVHGLFPRAQAMGGPEPATVDTFMQMKGERDQFMGRIDAALEGWEKFFDRLPIREQVAFLDRFKTGQPQPTREMQQLADWVKRLDDASYQQVKKYKPTLSYKENHFRVFWKVIPGSQKQGGPAHKFYSRRPLQGSKGFMKQATLRDVTDGILMGGVPYTYNPVKLLKMGLADQLKYITAQKMWEQLGSEGLDQRKFVRGHARPPEGYVKLQDRLADVYFPASSGEGMVEAGHWYVEKNAARLLNNFLSRDLMREHAATRGLLWLKNAMTAVELGLSPFHAIFETIEAAGSQLGLGLMRTWNQGVLEGDGKQFLKGIEQMATSPIAPLTLALKGGDLIRYIRQQPMAPAPPLPSNPVTRQFATWRQLRDAARMKKFVAQYPAVSQALNDLFAGGAQLKMHEDFRVDTIKSLLEAYHEENYIGMGIRLFPAALQGVMKPLFDVYIPRLKLGLFLEQYGQQTEQRADDLASGKITRPELAREVWDTVEDRFGEMNFDNLFWNRTFKSVMQLLLRSVTWKFGTARGFGKALTGQANNSFAEPIRLLRGGGSGGAGKPPASGAAAGQQPPFGDRARAAAKAALTLDPRLAWLFGVAATTVFLATVITRWRTGKWPWQWIEDSDNPNKVAESLLEFSHPRAGGDDDRGKPLRVTLPTYFRDAEGLADSPTRYLGSSTSALVGRSLEAWENRNFYGDYVYDPTDPLYQKLLDGMRHSLVLPISVTAYSEQMSRGVPKPIAALSLFGVTRARRDIDFTPAEKLMMSYVQASHMPRTPEEVKESRERYEAFEAGTLPLAEMRRMERARREDWSVRTFKSLNYWQAREVFEKGTPSEQALWYKPLIEKRNRLLKRSPEKVMEAEAATQ